MSEGTAPPPPRLAPCPASPNCVSSQAADPGHRIDPIRFTGSPEEAVERLKSVVRKQPRTRIVAETPLSFRAEFTSAVFRFVDDVDVVADPVRSLLEIRSASRVGHSDLGVNRKRVERLRAAFAPSPATPVP